MTTDRRTAVVVPAYNEAVPIAGVVGGLLPHCTWCIVVDDGSKDATAQLARSAGATVLRHPLNRGQGAALQTGIRYALELGADIVVSFDADGQHDPRDLTAITAPIVDGSADIALGSRFLGRTVGMPLTRRLVLKAGVLFTRLVSGVKLTDVYNGFRAWSRQAAFELTITLDGTAHASEILDQINARKWRFVEVPVTIYYTSYSIEKGVRSWSSVRYAIQLLLQRLTT